MKHKVLKRLTAGGLIAAMMLQLAGTALADVVVDDNVISFTDENGNVVESHTEEEWEELFPYGIFAFKESELSLRENGEDGTDKATLTLYRIGGTEGRAEATVMLTPAITQLDKDRVSYANAMGTGDYTVTVEDPWAIAYYQPFGRMDEIIYTGEAITYETVDESVYDTPVEGGEITPVTLYAPEGADSYQWQMQSKLFQTEEYVRRWSDIDGATEREMQFSDEMLDAFLSTTYTYDFRCIYVIDGVTYCSDSLRGEVYETGEDLPPVKPADFVDDRTRTDSRIAFDGGEYDSYMFPVVFADGEWEKEITFEVLDDDLHETYEMLSVVLTDSRGAEINMSASTATVSVEDDEEILPSEMGFAETDILFDKADGTVRIPVVRSTDAMQYVTGVTYELVDGTAVAGKDFAAEDGTTLFPSDMEYTYIELNLINDGIALSEEDSDLYFTVRLTEPMGGTLTDGYTEMTVRLYNSAESTGEANLATELYSADENDVTASVTESSAIVPVNKTVGASVVDPGENVVAEYSFVEDGISTYTHTYPAGTLVFPNAYGGNYWADYALLANDNVSVSSYRYPSASNSDDHEGYIANRTSLWTGYVADNWDGHISSFGSTGMELRTQQGGYMHLQIPNLNDRYAEARFVAHSISDKSGSLFDSYEDRSDPEVTMNGTYTSLLGANYSGADRWYTGSYTVYPTAGHETLEFRHRFMESGTTNDANCQTQLVNGYFVRRSIPIPILRIHTADDEYLEENAPLLHETIKPKVELVAGKGGTTADGSKLYNNSTVKVTRGDNASSYTYATRQNGALNDSLFFSLEDEDDRSENKSTVSVGSDGSGTLTVLMDASDVKKQGYINVVMDREQRFALEISPSVPRKEVEGGSSTDIDPEKIPETWEKLAQKIKDNGYEGITYTYREINLDFSDGNDGFSEPLTGTLNVEDMTQATSDSSLFSSATDLKNVRSINFHLNEGDLVVVSGKAYAGNEDIPISADQFLNDRVTFFYYDEEYVSSISTMLAVISRVERYIDLNDDGTVVGTIDPITGTFKPDEEEVEGETYYVLPSLTEESYPVTHLAPRGKDGAKHQIVLKAYYTMLPRSLVVPEGASETDTAEVIPAIVTSVTNPAIRGTMTEEELGYRYIDHKKTGYDKLMYTAAASDISYVDIPMGGNYGVRNSGRDEQGNEYYEWKPEWKGNPYPGTYFDDPEPIYMDGTLIGDNIPVGEVDKTGNLTEEGIETVNQYLSSMQANDTFSLCVRETPKDDGSSTFAMADTTVVEGLESSTLSETSTTAGSAAFGDVSDPTEDYEGDKESSMDSSEAGSAFPEYDMAGEINLPAMELGLTDFVSIGIDGQEMGISFGFGLLSGGWESDTAAYDDSVYKPWEGNGFSDTNRENVGKVKRFINSIAGPNNLAGTDKTLGDTKVANKQEINDAFKKDSNGKNMGTVVSKGIEVSFSIEFSILLKWDPIESRFFFNQAGIAFSLGLEASYTLRCAPAPIVFLCLKFSFSIELAFGLEASRVKVIGENVDFGEEYGLSGNWQYYKNQKHMGHDQLEAPEGDDFWVGQVGDSFTYTTNRKALDVHFTGSLYVEVIGKNASDLTDFQPGVIKSAGDEAVTVKLAKKVNGENLNDDYTLKFTVVENEGVRKYETKKDVYAELPPGATIVDRIVTIKRQTHDVYFSGVNISPELFLEAAIGLDVVLFTAEIFLNVSVGCSFAFAVHDSPDYSSDKDGGYSAFEFNEFSAGFTLGLRVSLVLVFNYEFTGLQFLVTYDRETKYDEDTNKKNGWNYIWYGANRPFEEYSLNGEEADPLETKVVLASQLNRKEMFYRPEDNLPSEATPFAFDPSDKNVPFQYSGYGTSGDAFSLTKDIIPGSTYELVSTQGKNYLVYTRTRDEYDSDVDMTELVLSEVRETAVLDENKQPVMYPDGTPKEAYGLVDPTDDNKTYLVLDDDNTGDADFDVWVDENGDIRVAWVSYTADAATAYTAVLKDVNTANVADAMRAAGPHTEVKTVKVDIEKDEATETYTATKEDVEVVTKNDANHGRYYLPSGAGDMVFYAEAEYYTDEDLQTLLKEYRKYLGTVDVKTLGTTFYGEGDPTADYQIALLETRAQTYGKSFYPTFAIRQEDGQYAVSKVGAESWLKDGVQLDNASLALVGDTYYAAYTTSDTDLTEDKTDELSIKKLYLQKLAVESVSPPTNPDDQEEPGTPEDSDNTGDSGNTENPDNANAFVVATDPTLKVTPGKATAIRELVSYTKSDNADGVYANNGLKTEYADPYFSNVNFLTGKLGGLDAEAENFEEQIEMTPYTLATQTFLLFEMNGNTYVIPEASLTTITGNNPTGKIIPFFTQLTAEEINKEKAVYREADPIVTNINIGADGNGNITAVYTRSESGAPGNAVYMTKYDPQSTTWGAGTRLAMLDMDTLEQAEAEGLSSDETATKYYDTNGNGKLDEGDAPQSFAFSKVRVGIAGEDKLLIVSEGSLTQLEPVVRKKGTYAPDEVDAFGNLIQKGKLTGLTDELDKENNVQYSFNAKLNPQTGAYDVTKGVYALSFGMGQQSLSAAGIHMSNYDLTPDSEMNVFVSFVNGGDVAIRASEQNPATVTLWADDNKLAEWNVIENIRAGQQLMTNTARVTLPNDLENGDKIYFTVNEDTDYISGSSGKTFTATTITEGNEETAACIIVADRVEMGYESFEINMVSADDDTVTLAPDIHVGNRGSADSDMTYLQFQYEKTDKDGNVTLYPVDLTGHKLTISDEAEISRFGDERTLQNGYILLRTMQDGVEVDDATEAGQIQSMYGRTVTGTFTVPKEYYNTDVGTGSLNLYVTIESYNESGDANAEYDTDNNQVVYQVEPKTLFTTVNSVTMQKGSTLRLPVTMETSTMTSPTVTVTELTDDDVRKLSVLYYDANQGAIVVMPAEEEGEGKIRIADTATNSFHDICYRIKGEGTAINIFDDNGIFTWYDKNGNGGDEGHDAWSFDGALSWTDTLTTMPLNSNLSEADKGESFSFQSFAKKIDLYFMGTSDEEEAVIEVTSNLPGFMPVQYTSANGETPVTIEFPGESAVAHTITITAKSDKVRFDRVQEYFGEDLNVSTDPTAPGIYWSRTLPEPESLTKNDKLPLTVYFTDLGGMVSVTLDGEDVTDKLKKDGDELWYLPMEFESNGTHRFVVTDTSGNTTTRDMSVDWFSETATETTDPGAPEITASLVQADGSDAPSLIPSDMNIYLSVKEEDGTVVKADLAKLVYNNNDAPTEQYFSGQDSAFEENLGYQVYGGIYRVSVTNEEGVTSYRFVNYNNIDSGKPTVELRFDEENAELIYFVEKAVSANSDAYSPIVSIKLNGVEELLGENQTTYRESGTVPVAYGGTYWIVATDEAGNETKCDPVTIPSLPITVPEDEIVSGRVDENVTTDKYGNPVYTSRQNGTVVIPTDRIRGGSVDTEASEETGTIRSVYEFALVPSGEKISVGDWESPEDGATEMIFEGLDAGEYDLYIRDANAPDNILGPIKISVEYLRVIIQNVDVTDVTSKNAADGTITVRATGGTGTLEYALTEKNSDSDTEPTWQTENTFTELAAGTYILLVRDRENPENCAETEVRIERPDDGQWDYIQQSMAYYRDMKFSITAEASEGGSITNEGVTEAGINQKVRYEITADEGYRIASVLIDGKDIGAVTEYVFSDIRKDHTIEAVFETIVPETTAPLSPFVDVADTDWYADDVAFVYEEGLMNGIGNGEFAPDMLLNRATVVTTLWRLSGSPVGEYTFTYDDLAEGEWYTDAMKWAISEEIIRGYGDGTCQPLTEITHEQAVAILHRYAAFCGVTDVASEPAYGYLCSAWAEDDVNWAEASGLFEGFGSNLSDLTAPATRAEIAAYLRRICALLEE